MQDAAYVQLLVELLQVIARTLPSVHLIGFLGHGLMSARTIILLDLDLSHFLHISARLMLSFIVLNRRVIGWAILLRGERQQLVLAYGCSGVSLHSRS